MCGSVLENPLEEFCKGEDGGFRQAAFQFCLDEYLNLTLGYFYGVPEVGNDDIVYEAAVKIYKAIKGTFKFNVVAE